VIVDILVEFPIGEEIVATEGGAAFAPVASSDVRPQPEVVVALDAQDEKFVERGLAESLAGADLSAHLVIVARALREPSRLHRTLKLGEDGRLLGPDAAELSRGAPRHGKSMLRRVKQFVIELSQVFELETLRQQLRSQNSAGFDVTEATVGELESG